MKHVMLDLETLGTRPGCVVMSIGAVAFDLDGSVGNDFYRVIDRRQSMDCGLVTDPDTVAWWKRQSVTARAAVTRDPQPILTVVRDFATWFSGLGAIYVWGQGASFDPPIWEGVCRAVGQPAPWRFYNHRDTRTAYDLRKFDPKSIARAGVYHNALDDARHQVACIHAAMGVRCKAGSRSHIDLDGARELERGQD